MRTKIGVNDLSRIMTAAVVNQKFRELLLSNPAAAMQSGYLGEEFSLDSDEMELVLSIQATNLADFAQQLLKNRTPSGANHMKGSANYQPQMLSFPTMQLGSIGND